MYADDSTIYSSAKTIEELNVKLTHDMSNVHTWFTNNKHGN
jgi:3-keto-L-gulonate-6-phosphate decarboxylase